MIPGHPPNTTYSTIAFEDFGVNTCASQVGCPKGLGYKAHRWGRVDRAGTIHWSDARRRATRRGMRNLMKLMALVMVRDYWYEPRWRRLWLQNVWAFKTIKARYHYMCKLEWSIADRKLAYHWALIARKDPGSLRWKHRNFYKWLYDAGVVGSKGYNPKRRRVTKPSV